MTIKHVAAATIIVASLSVSAYALSQTPTSSRAEDAPMPTVQSYTAPDVVTPITRDALTTTPVATPAPEPTYAESPVIVAHPLPVVTSPVVVAPSYPVYTLPACQTEDSNNCYWDAAAMGNGVGESFITLNGVTYYAR